MNISCSRALTEVKAVNYAVDISQNPREQCPLCKTGIPINTRVGHGEEFLAEIKEMSIQIYIKNYYSKEEKVMAGMGVASGEFLVSSIDKTKLFLPLDVPTIVEAGNLLVQLAPFYDVAKVGLELLTSVGAPAAVNLPKVFGLEVFADTKFYNIPNTVRCAADAITRHGVAYFNVMAEGSQAMMEAAVEGAYDSAHLWGISRPKVIAVTIPISQSYDDLLRKGMVPVGMKKPETREEQQAFITYIVMKLAKDAVAAGVDCLLSSPIEAPEMIKKWPDKKVITTPGIRNPDSPPDDQNRKMSPYEARMTGITHMVIGRLVTQPPKNKTMANMASLVRKDIARAEIDLCKHW